jgi:hypothetical protein
MPRSVPWPRSGLAILAAVLSAVTVARSAAERSPAPPDTVLAAVVLADERPETREAAMEAVRATSGSVAHAFDGFLVVEATRESLRRLVDGPGVRDVSIEAIPATSYRRRGGGFAAGVATWNRFFKSQAQRFAEFSRDEEPRPPLEGQDSWLPPAAADTRAADAGSSASATQPYGATDKNTSEFLTGSISINLFLVQSDGTVDLSTEKWTEVREQAVVAQVAAGLDWLRDKEPAAGLSFVYHVIAGRVDARARTGYEPINRKADPSGSTGENLWVNQILSKMGYADGDRWTRSRALANATRRADGTDWGVNVFVADSLVDGDGRFADGYFAYTWIGGPHVVMTYDDQSWGIDRMNQVFRHEALHCFYAFDEYASSGCKCADHRGYLDGTNANCHACNASAVPCVMDSNGPSMCADTRRQIGWADLTGDGAYDVIGEDPDTSLDSVPATVCGAVELKGQGTVVAAANRNPAGITPQANISVNRIARVEWSVEGETWYAAIPADGAWGDYVETCSASVSLLPGSYTLELRAVDDHGNVDLVASRAKVDVLSAATDPGDVLAAARASGAGAALSWIGAREAAMYRVYRCTAAAGPCVCVAETTGTAWVDATAGDGYYRVSAVDACGAESAP